MIENIVIYIFGTIGIILVLIAYFLLQAGKWKSDGIQYLLANIIGSTLLITTNYYEWNLSSFTINVSWLLISLYGFYCNILSQKTD